jgi:hypothetical protein
MNSFEDIIEKIKSHSLNVGIVPSRHMINFFRQSTDPIVREIYESFAKSEVDVNLLNANLSSVLNGKSVLIAYSYVLRAFVKKYNYLPFYVGRDMYGGHAFVFLYSKFISQSLKEKLDLLVFSSFESGLIDFWRQKRVVKTQETLSFEENNFESISFHYLKGIYIIFVFGLFISVFCYIFEIIFKHNEDRRRRCLPHHKRRRPLMTKLYTHFVKHESRIYPNFEKINLAC